MPNTAVKSLGTFLRNNINIGKIDFISFQRIGLKGPIHHQTQNKIDLMNPDKLYKPSTNIC